MTKRQLEHEDAPCPLRTREEIEQFYAGLARTELNRESGREKLKWWSEASMERFPLSFRRPSIEAVDEVVKRLSGDSLVYGSEPLPESSIESDDLETMVHRISVSMESLGRRPSMEELAAGISIFSTSNGLEPAQQWLDEDSERVVRNNRTELSMEDLPWSKAARTSNRVVISATTQDDEVPEASISQNNASDLKWLRQSSSAGVELLQQNKPGLTHSTSGWTLNHALEYSQPRTTIKACMDSNTEHSSR